MDVLVESSKPREKVHRMPDLIRRNLNKSLKKVFLFPQVFGLCPLKLGPTGFSVFPLILAVSTCFLISIFIWTVSNIIITPYHKFPFIHFLSVTIRTILILLIGSCVVTTLRSVRKMNHIFDDLWCIDNFLSMFGSVVKDSFSLYFCIICIILHIVMFLVLKFGSKEPTVLANALVYLSFMITHAAECQYIGMLDIFLNRYRAINSCLKKLRFNKDSLGDGIVILSNVHLLLSDSLSAVSRMYSLQLFLFTAISLARFIVFLFTMVFLQPSRTKGPFILYYAAFSFWFFLSFLIFFRVIRIIVKVTREVIYKTTSKLLML